MSSSRLKYTVPNRFFAFGTVSTESKMSSFRLKYTVPNRFFAFGTVSTESKKPSSRLKYTVPNRFFAFGTVCRLQALRCSTFCSTKLPEKHQQNVEHEKALIPAPESRQQLACFREHKRLNNHAAAAA